MSIDKRIEAFTRLGEKISMVEEFPDDLWIQAEQCNSWFTRENITTALLNISKLLQYDALSAWVSSYELDGMQSKKVGTVMAGNIPLVGFTDFLAIVISGHQSKIKLSSQDNVLLPYLVKQLLDISPELEKQIAFVDQLKGIDAVIATGSDNTSRYFEYYFGKYPHIIRKNRTSCAILTGDESSEDLEKLGRDIFTYYGLGCRNVSKIFVPEGYDYAGMLDCFESYAPIIHHHKYRNNYDYNKSIYLINKVAHLDNGFLLLTENEGLVSPISVLYSQQYKSIDDLDVLIDSHKGKIQCIVSGGVYPKSVPFGDAQIPQLADYADNIDVMDFLSSI